MFKISDPFLKTSAILQVAVVSVGEYGYRGRVPINTVKRRKAEYFGHMIRAQNIATHVSEGRLSDKISHDRPCRRLVNDIADWTAMMFPHCTTTTTNGNSRRNCCIDTRSLTVRDEDGMGHGRTRSKFQDVGRLQESWRRPGHGAQGPTEVQYSVSYWTSSRADGLTTVQRD